jgi:membrane-bound metal-dependent hydrolase YbcI (DUF457 family)
MLLFGHTGITLGLAMLLKSTLARATPQELETSVGQQKIISGSSENFPKHIRASKSRLFLLLERIDIRVLLIGSLLPDIIDKPLGQLLLKDTLSNGRTFCHTLLFFLLIFLTGFYLYRNKGKDWGIILSFGVFVHLILDQMWRTPQTLLWPIYGFAFPKGDIANWLNNVLLALYTDPAIYLPELIGAVILIWFLVLLVRKGHILSFIKSGEGW